MKKIFVITACVLCSTLVFANGTEEPSKSGSSMAVLSSGQSNLVKVLYKAPSTGKVKISIRNERNELVYSETIKQQDGFMRPYNFSELPGGQYSVQVDDAYGRQVEKVNYHASKASTLVHLTRLAGKEERILLTGVSSEAERINVRIFDGAHQTIFEDQLRVAGAFGEVFNMKNISGPFTIEVGDSHGVLKTLSN